MTTCTVEALTHPHVKHFSIYLSGVRVSQLPVNCLSLLISKLVQNEYLILQITVNNLIGQSQ